MRVRYFVFAGVGVLALMAAWFGGQWVLADQRHHQRMAEEACTHALSFCHQSR